MPEARSPADRATARPHVVIVGCQRSGTTVLQRIIAQNFDLAPVLESHFIPHFHRFRWLWGSGGRYDARGQLAAIYRFLELRYRFGDRYDFDTVAPHSFLATRGEAVSITARAEDYSSLLQVLFDAFSRIGGRSGVIERTAYYDWPPVALLAELIPTAKFVFIVRDGRGVAHSWSRTWFGPRTIGRAARMWCAQTRDMRRFCEANPDRCLRVRYEDLVADTEAVVRRLEPFLEAAPCRTVEPDPLFVAVAELDEFSNVGRTVTDASVEEWKTGLAPADIARFERIAGGELVANGYGPIGPAQPGTRPGAVLDSLRECLSLNALKRAVMRSLPPLLRLYGLLRAGR